MFALILCLTFAFITPTPSVPLNQNQLYNVYTYGNVPQNYYIVPYYTQRFSANNYGQNGYSGGRHLNGPVYVDPSYGYGNYIPLTPVPIPNDYIPIVGTAHFPTAPAMRGTGIQTAGRPTHPDYRPPTQWSRLWPPANWNPSLPGGGVDYNFEGNYNSFHNNNTTESPGDWDNEDDREEEKKKDKKISDDKSESNADNNEADNEDEK